MGNKDLIEQRIIDCVNKEIGRDFKKLYRAAVLIDNYKNSIERLKKNLNHNNETEMKFIESALQSQDKISMTVGFQKEKLEKFYRKLSPNIDSSNETLSGVLKDLGKVRQLQQLSYYLKIVKDIQEISQSLNNAVYGRDEAKMVNIYLTLFEDKDCENSIIGRLSNIESHYLKLFAAETASYWHKVLSEKFARELESILQSIRWGCKEYNSLTFSTPCGNIDKAKLLAEYLFLIKCPIKEDAPLKVITPSIICPPVSTVTKLLLAQYQQRFQYHFTGVRQTNRLDKPEWYFTQILNWIKDAHIFVGKTFQQSAVKAGILDYNIRLEFIRGLVQMIIEKLIADIEDISRDEHLYAHLLDETLAFEAELRGNFGYPSSFPSAICVITQPIYLLKWISLEERFCGEKIDLILHGDDPWMIIDPNFCDNDLKIPKCADQFIRLLEAIQERYSTLIQPGQQLQFLSLQLELIENFRQRLVQLFSSGEVGIVSILNAINYLALVLNEWGENVHYLHLHAALVGQNSNEILSVFDQPVGELEHWTKKLIESLATKAVNEIKAKSMAYRHDCWAFIPDQNCKEPFILSSSAGEMFQFACIKMDRRQTLRILAAQLVQNHYLIQKHLNTLLVKLLKNIKVMEEVQKTILGTSTAVVSLEIREIKVSIPVMVTTIHNMERDLSLNLFNLTLRIVANHVDEFLFDSLVMNNKFTPAGAAQFSFDMTRNLFPLFGQYYRRPDLLFKKVHDSNKLLNVPLGTALLLRETLMAKKNLEQKMLALKELGIVNFKYQACIHILERRTDLKVL